MLLNLERARGLMQEYGIDVLIATTPENVNYVADYSPWNHRVYRGNTPEKGAQVYVILPRDASTPPAIVPLGSGYNTFTYAAEFPGWIDDYYPYTTATGWPGKIPEVPEYTEPDTPPEVRRLRDLTVRFAPKVSKTPGEAVVKALKDRGLDRGVAAFESYGMSPSATAHLEQECPDLELKEAAEFIRFIRAVKTPDEIHNLRRSAEINEIAFQEMMNLLEPGQRTIDLAIQHRVTCSREGAIPSFLNVSAAGHPGVMWEPMNYVLRPGDVVWMDGGCDYHHYHSDTGMSAVLGEPTARMRETFGAVQACMEAGFAACKPGASSSKIQNAMHRPLLERGWDPPFAFGHGIGAEERDWPVLQAPFREWDDAILKGSTDLPMEVNNVICLEVNLWEWGVG
ncbi:MAG: aminopeptidase P family protein, partial [Chloroflexi bacterium]|nr:aminopeptidase P family protein [Chloroflexota bacterium]